MPSRDPVNFEKIDREGGLPVEQNVTKAQKAALLLEFHYNLDKTVRSVVTPGIRSSYILRFQSMAARVRRNALQDPRLTNTLINFPMKARKPF